jgi:hypothetical protein
MQRNKEKWSEALFYENGIRSSRPFSALDAGPISVILGIKWGTEPG